MKNFGNILWGIVLIVIGIIIGGNAIGVINVDLFFDGWWTLFIIIPCFIGLFKEREKTGNVIGLLIGVVLLLCAQGLVDFDMIWKLALPAILVIFGISLIFKDTFNKKVSDEIKKINKNNKNDNEHFATFSGQNLKFDNEKFNGANLTAVFGGIKCDLRDAIIEEDVVINSTSVFGGIDIYVPENLKVKIKSTSIFGGVDDKKVKDVNDEKAHTLYINATCVFGGVDVK